MTDTCRSALSLCFTAALTLAVASCASEGGGDGPECDGDKCDDPGSSAQRECELACKSSQESDCVTKCREGKAMEHCEARRSDPTICTAAMRAAECGCGVDTSGDGKPDLTSVADIARALVPRQVSSAITLRGFKLGTWSGATSLPAGCRYLDTGDTSQTVVACNLTASDVLSAQTDVKGKCREKYGDNVVVHIPVPGDAIVCAPPADGQYSATCGDMVPWTESDGAPAECCRTCSSASKPCGDSCISKDSTCNQEPGCACAGS
jgi:hypothetical protein